MINTQKLRTFADSLDSNKTPLRVLTAIHAAADHIDAQQAEIDRYRRAAGRWKKVAESAEERVRDQAAEIAEAKGQFEHLDRQNNALRDVLRSLADIDLAGPMPNDFAWFVLRARAALSGESND